MNNKSFFGYKAAVGAFLIIFVNLGVATTLGIFLASLAEYSGWSVAMCGYIGTANTIGNIFLSMLAARALPKIGVRKCMLISIVSVILHVWLYTFATPGQNVMTLVFYYLAGLVCSFAITFGTHAACSTLIAEWFVEKREKITGIVLSGAGFGAALWVFLAGQLFQYFDFKMCYRIISVLALVIGGFALIFLVKTPEEMGQKPLGWDKVDNSAKTEQIGAIGVSKADAMKSSSFWLFAVAMLCVCVAYTAFTSYAPTWWQTCGLSSTTAANWNAAQLIIAALFLLVAGSIFAKVGASVFTTILCVAFVACMALMCMIGSGTSAVLMVLIVLLAGLSYPLNASVPSMVGQSLFGGKDFAAISATMMTAVYLGQFLCAPIMAIFLGMNNGFVTAWTIFAVAAIVGLVLILVAIAKAPVKKLKGN
ncbi:MAG: MFS transporter [Lachnospiraceae bacterium]|nr:MFS transporter [Lachnospiraceae bacterium]